MYKVSFSFMWVNKIITITSSTFLGLVIAFLLSGCAIGLETSPELAQVKKSAFLSVYINNEFYNRETYKEDIGLELLNFFDQEINVKDNKLPKALVNYFVDSFFERYQNLPVLAKKIDIVKPQVYFGSPQYNLPVKEDTDVFANFEFDNTFNIAEYYFTPSDGLKLITLNSVIKQIKAEGELGGQIAESISYADIGNFSEKLNMDGMMIAELDASYQKMTFLEGSKIKPLLNIRIILINNDGNEVLTIGKDAKSERRHFFGKIVEASINEKDKIIFSSNPKEIEDGYRVAIDKALDNVLSSIGSASRMSLAK